VGGTPTFVIGKPGNDALKGVELTGEQEAG